MRWHTFGSPGPVPLAAHSPASTPPVFAIGTKVAAVGGVLEGTAGRQQLKGVVILLCRLLWGCCKLPRRCSSRAGTLPARRCVDMKGAELRALRPRRCRRSPAADLRLQHYCRAAGSSGGAAGMTNVGHQGQAAAGGPAAPGPISRVLKGLSRWHARPKEAPRKETRKSSEGRVCLPEQAAAD